MREEAAARWDNVYGVINTLQRAYNEAEDLLDVSIKVRKSFPPTWQPAYVVSFARPGAPSIEIRLAMREDNVVSFTIAKRIDTETLPKVFEEGTTFGDRESDAAAVSRSCALLFPEGLIDVLEGCGDELHRCCRFPVSRVAATFRT